MITKIDKDLYHVQTMDNGINLELSFVDLKERLLKNSCWNEEAVDALKDMDIGDDTGVPTAYYIINGIRYTSHHGVMGKAS